MTWRVIKSWGGIDVYEGGAVLMVDDDDPDAYQYLWWGSAEADGDDVSPSWTRATSLEQDDDEPVWLVHRVSFGLRDDLLEQYSRIDPDDVADAHGETITAKQFEQFAVSRDPLEKVEFFRAVIVTDEDERMLDPSPQYYDEPEMFNEFGAGFPRVRQRVDVSSDLEFINERRKKIGLRPLDPAAAGWSDEDVRLEAARLRANPDVRAQLLGWF